MESRTDASRILVGITYRKASLGRGRCRCKNIIKTYYQDVECGGMD